MKKSPNVIALLCGRGGSQSVKDKNLYPVLGRPMLVYPLLAAKRSRTIDKVFISTDSIRMQEIAAAHGAHVIDRPPHLATATAQHVDTLIHALDVIRARGETIDFLVVLMCNCATLREGVIDECVEKLIADENADSCVTGYIENDHHPYRVKKMSASGYLTTWIDLKSEEVSTNRQDLPACYILDHAIWVLRTSTCFPPNGQKPWTFMGNNICFVDNHGSCDIHSYEDIQYTEQYLKEQGWSEETKTV